VVVVIVIYLLKVTWSDKMYLYNATMIEISLNIICSMNNLLQMILKLIEVLEWL